MKRYLNALKKANTESEALRDVISGLDIKLSTSQARMLYALNLKSPSTAAQAAEASQTLGPSVSRMLRDMQEKGLIVVKVDDSDHRTKLISITAKGRRIITKIMSKTK